MFVTTLIALIALLHLYIMVLEMVLWTGPRGQRAFGITAAYAMAGLRQLGWFMLHNVPFLILLPIALYMARRAQPSGFSRIDKALMVGLVIFLGFHAFLVTPIMGYHQRFLYPIWPAIVYLACKSLSIVLKAAPAGGWPIMNLPWGKPVLALALSAWMLGSIWLHKPTNLRTTIGHMDVSTAYHELGRNNWPFLPEFLYLGDSLEIASTELGILGVMAAHNTIYDLSGLHDNETARNGLNTDRLLRDQRPDLIYMPHPDYQEMIQEIRSNPAFQTDYAEYPAEQLHTWLGIALRKDSPFFVQMEYIIQQAKNVDDQNAH